VRKTEQIRQFLLSLPPVASLLCLASLRKPQRRYYLTRVDPLADRERPGLGPPPRSKSSTRSERKIQAALDELQRRFADDVLHAGKQCASTLSAINKLE